MGCSLVSVFRRFWKGVITSENEAFPETFSHCLRKLYIYSKYAPVEVNYELQAGRNRWSGTALQNYAT